MSPTRKPTSWAGAIPLIAVLGGAVVVGGALAELHWNTTALEALSAKVDRMADGLVQRIAALEQWRAAQEAAVERRRR